jgi:hypothetical protein
MTVTVDHAPAETATRDRVSTLIRDARTRIGNQGSFREGGWMRPLNVLDRSVQYAMHTVPLSIHAALLVQAGFTPFLLDDPSRTDCVPPISVAHALDRIASHLVAQMPKKQRQDLPFDSDRNLDCAAVIAMWEQHPDRTERDVLNLLQDLSRVAAWTTQSAARKVSA